MADYTRIRSTVDAYIATLTLDRPEHGNAVDDAMHSELTRVFADMGRDPDVRVVVLTGAGTTFCRGGDSSPTRTFTTLTGLTPIEEARLIVETLLDLDKPVIAAVNGDALGLGAILASLADVAFVAPTARVGDRHVLGGVTAGNGSAALWPVLVGLNRAKYLVLNGELLTADQAVSAGLLHEVVADPLSAARELATRWATLSPFALRSTKSVLNRHLKAAADEALGYGLALEEQSLAEFTARRAR
ncbi:enoyl-CoA hydratase/isomerase family protein [Actinophytocola sp. NPDC049390]|uniref:enoyl-CoA hydratase/isomerase family protein n=1 Tax=Actinophytocola sp. NPDC049390 TaxID=3363894 RepID=UPI003795B5CC